jgi:hypothetical protein
MKRMIAVTLVAALILPALPAFAAENTDLPASRQMSRQAARPAVSLRESAKQAVGVSTGTAAAADVTATAYGPRSMPRQGSDGVRKQMGGGGGSKTGMIIGLVSAAAGIAGTVYMVKMMKKTTADPNK